MKDAGTFLGHEKKQRVFFLGCEKGTLRDFFGYAKKSSDFFGSTTNVEVVIFLGIKYKPLSDSPPPPPVIKICEWGPWVYTTG